MGILQILCVLFFCGLLGQTAQAADDDKRVLFISSYSYAWDQVQMQIEGFQDVFGEDVTLDYEFMDTKRVDTEESL